jgi:hypothetical protein
VDHAPTPNRHLAAERDRDRPDDLHLAARRQHPHRRPAQPSIKNLPTHRINPRCRRTSRNATAYNTEYTATIDLRNLIGELMVEPLPEHGRGRLYKATFALRGGRQDLPMIGQVIMRCLVRGRFPRPIASVRPIGDCLGADGESLEWAPRRQPCGLRHI